jgi:hypothetical protein
MSGTSVGASIERFRRRPLWTVWAVLSGAWMLFVRLVDPDSALRSYFWMPIYIAVAFMVTWLGPRRHVGWLPPLVTVAVRGVFLLGWQPLA